MADFTDSIKAIESFFHSRSSFLVEDNQAIYESFHRSAHTVRSANVWANSIIYCLTSEAADAEATLNSAVTKHTLVSLTEVAGSNGQSWELIVDGETIKPWISPLDIPHSTTLSPSYGFQTLLYDSSDNRIFPTIGAWYTDYLGIIKFASGYTPTDLSYGTPKITCYSYSGTFSTSIYVKSWIYNPINGNILNTIPLNGSIG